MLDKRILLKQEEPKNQNEFFESLISSGDKEQKEVKATILLHCINQLFSLGDIQTVDLIINNLLSFMPDILADKSNHIQSYLWFFLNLTTSGY